jgi:SAM-dependent methyltransferase
MKKIDAEKAKSVKAAVREHYASLVKDGTRESCCGASCEVQSVGANGCSPLLAQTLGYDESELDGIPEDAVESSFGCGNPLAFSEMKEGEVVLDLGSGAGMDVLLAAKKVGARGKVIGLDMTPEMIEKAKKNASAVGATSVEFRLGEMEDMPVEDGSVDLIISNCVINLSPDKERVFKEAYRVLKPGGRLSVSDIVTNGPMSPLVSKGLGSWAACVAGALDMKDYREGLEAAGFVDVRVAPKEGAANSLLARIPAGVPFSALITARKPDV